MANYYTNVYITDSRNHKILIVLKGNRSATDGIWYVHNDYLGWLAVNKGNVYYHNNTNALYLLGSGGSWGILLNNHKYLNSGYVNMEGSYGTILQPWVLAFESGDIVWDAPAGIVKL